MTFIHKGTFAISLFVLFLIAASCQDLVPDACIEYSDKMCIRCNFQTHLAKGLCYLNILGCTSYKSASTCSQCQSPTYQLVNDTCIIAPGKGNKSELIKTLYKYSGQSNYDPGSQYGSASFMPISFSEVSKWPTFLALNKYITQGQYGFYISRMSNPVYSVHYYITNSMYSYKVLYHGSGGGLFLCIADVPPSMYVDLRSLTPISASSIVDNCFDYDVSGSCLQCKDGQHLESGKCFTNYGGCIKYIQNICLQCQEYYLLVENRCTSDCQSVSDLRSILHYGGNYMSSSMEIYYGVSISVFYSWITTVTTTTTTTVSYSTVGQSQTAMSGISQNIAVNSSQVSGASTSQSSTTSSTSNSVKPVVSSGISILNSTMVPTISTSSQILPSSLDTTTTYHVISSQPIIQTTSSTLNFINTHNITNNSIKQIDILDGSKFYMPNITQTNIFPTVDSNCLTTTDKGLCSKCAEEYFINEYGICEEISPLCLAITELDGKCKLCFKGYTLDNGRCLAPKN